MTAIKQNGLAMAAMTLALTLILAVQAMPGAAQQGVVKQAEPVAKAPEAALENRMIVVSLADHKLALIKNGQVKKIYPVAVGKPSTPSPAGMFKIERRVMNPTYSHNGRIVLPGPGNPVGTRWMGLSIKGYGIHGTNEPRSIGKAASHGCIRMAKADIEELYGLVAVGDTVELVGQSNDETARLFGDGSNPAVIVAPSTAQIAPKQIAKSESTPAPAQNAKGAESLLTPSGSDAAALTANAGTM